jgi:ribosome-dependent ATPase
MAGELAGQVAAAMTASQPIAHLQRVTQRYRKLAALDSIDLALPAGRMIGFIGPDGVGKSTLLALISGARKIQQGRVEVLGGDMADRRHRRAVCARIAYMPQGLGKNLSESLSVLENLEFFGTLFAQSDTRRRAHIEELLQATGLEAFRHRPVGKLSGGMKQKLGLCCALIHDPDLLILDEPTTGVDPLSRRNFWELIERMRVRRPSMSVLVATAYFEEAERFDLLVAMDAGRAIAFDAPASLKARTAASSVEQAFVALLPEARRDGHRALAIEQRSTDREEIVIEAHELTRSFGDFVAVDKVGFRIARGEIFGFLGSNGSGKTTTMKMLCGLLDASAGSARLFGKPVEARDLATRRRVGVMSQSFSLYTELTVRQNLVLHARLFNLPHGRAAARIEALTRRFGLIDYLDHAAESLPPGVKQRLSLAVAVVHEPEVLILDEPTSGVDPVARDRFWELLLDLSRHQGVTIFVSTHFMNEAERCDRISLMHAGRVLTQGAPAEIVRSAGANNLEEAFIFHLQRVEADAPAAPKQNAVALTRDRPGKRRDASGFSAARLWAYAWREATEVRREPIRLAFALLGPILLMIVFGYGISFDVEKLSYAALDYDNSPQSRAYLENFSGSRYFRPRAPLKSDADLQSQLRAGKIRLAIEIPPGFGRGLLQGRSPEVALWLDGALPFRAEVSRGYVEGVHQTFLRELAAGGTEPAGRGAANLELRFRYNQEFLSVFAIVPGVIMMLLVLIPAVMTALGVVREKELGSIVNVYVTPTRGLEFLLGKQLPYIGVALLNFITLLALAVLLFKVPVKGSVAALGLGAVLYVVASTGFGLFISSFVKSQIAAFFATAILTTLPAIQFSGFLLPVSSMSADAQLIGRAFPSIYFQHISVGAFTKALGASSLAGDLAALALFGAAIIALSRAALKTQET